MHSTRTLHIRVEETDSNRANLRYYFENPNDYRERTLDLSEIAALVQNAENGYYTILPEDFSQTGQKLYHWLDSADRFLDQAIQQARGTAEILVLAFETKGRLSHLPWEILHDGTGFFVQRRNPMIVPVRWFSQNSGDDKPANRTLHALFMATSPDNVSLLDFEKEEALILNATQKQPMTLIVEESREIGELRNLISSYPSDWFDVFHLTGHGTLTDSGASFVTENEIGEAVLCSAKDLSDALLRMPRLIFLSGCRTAESAKAGAILSLAEELIHHGAKAVLGWGRPVSDTDASIAAAELYRALSCGCELPKALALTRQCLLENNARDWHLLRLAIAGEMPGALVTPLNTPKREKAKPLSFASRFLDAHRNIKVAPREEFVGRCRFLQRCLKSLRYDRDKTGVLLFGMGGIGKSTLAARLCDRMTGYQPLVWVGKVDEFSLVNRMCDDLDLEKVQRDALRNPVEELRYRLRTVFENHDRPMLLVLDDFEANLEMRNREHVPSVEAKTVLQALCFAIRKSESAHRLILTCRYQFDTQESPYFHMEQVTALDRADVRKKVDRLEKTKNSDAEEIRNLKQKAVTVADGNPRLLEWLFAVLGEKGLEYEKILSKMAEKETEFRENILAEELLKQQAQAPELKKMLALASVYELPVPKHAVGAVCQEIEDWEKHLERAVALGLAEKTVLPEEENLFRVSRILVPVLKADLPEDVEEWSGVAAQILYKIWYSDTSTEEQDFEIHRLALAGKEKEIAVKLTVVLSNQWYNRSRFRELVILCNNTLNAIGNDYRILHNLAKAQEDIGEVENALKNYQNALQDCPDEDEGNKAAIVHNMAGIYMNQGKPEQALQMFQQSLELKERIGDVQGRAATLGNIAQIYSAQGKMDEALGLFKQVLELTDVNSPQYHATTLHEIARIYQKQGRTEEALQLFQQSLGTRNFPIYRF